MAHDAPLIGIDASRITRPRRTGTEHYSLEVLREVLRQDARNRHRLYLSAPLPHALLPLTARDETRLISLPRLWTQVGLSSEMLRAAPDLLFVPSHVLPLVAPLRSVVVIYDVGHRLFPRAHRASEWLYLEWAIRRHVRLATRIITISEASKRDLVRLYGADARRISVAFPAADTQFRPQTAADVERVRARYGLSGQYVLHVGSIKPRKNLPRLIRAFAAARLSPGATLVLAGQALGGRAEVDRAIAETGLRARITLLSYVAGADLPALYAGSCCTAVVSLYEGFGMPALEALACGAPLVVSSHGSLPEVAGDAALVVDPLDIISVARVLERVVEDTALAARLREAGPRRAASFTWQAAGRVTLDAIDQAAASPRQRAPRGLSA